jgi:hypothetical protein
MASIEENELEKQTYQSQRSAALAAGCFEARLAESELLGVAAPR